MQAEPGLSGELSLPPCDFRLNFLSRILPLHASFHYAGAEVHGVSWDIWLFGDYCKEPAGLQLLHPRFTGDRRLLRLTHNVLGLDGKKRLEG